MTDYLQGCTYRVQSDQNILTASEQEVSSTQTAWRLQNNGVTGTTMITQNTNVMHLILFIR